MLQKNLATIVILISPKSLHTWTRDMKDTKIRVSDTDTMTPGKYECHNSEGHRVRVGHSYFRVSGDLGDISIAIVYIYIKNIDIYRSFFFKL